MKKRMLLIVSVGLLIGLVIGVALIAVLRNFLFVETPLGVRYKHEIFSKVDVTKDVVYGKNYDSVGNLVELEMDIYEPQEDKAESRALIIFIHGGGFTGGDKAGDQWVELCTTFAKRGYVTTSINYRLQPRDNVDYGKAITQAMYDAKAVIRYFRANAVIWRIDDEKIFLAGGSAGAITALHATYLTEPEYEGNSGNFGYSSNVSACVDLWGGLYINVNKIDAGESPVLIIHGTEDKVVSFSEAVNIAKRCEEVGVHCEMHALEGKGHGPWYIMIDFLPWIVDFLYNKIVEISFTSDFLPLILV